MSDGSNAPPPLLVGKFPLINEVLDMSKIEAGRIELSEQIFDFRQMLKRIEEMIRP